MDKDHIHTSVTRVPILDLRASTLALAFAGFLKNNAGITGDPWGFFLVPFRNKVKPGKGIKINLELIIKASMPSVVSSP